MLKLGDKSISRLYLGDKAINRAYLGDKLVFQANKPNFLEYIVFDGASYINTGIRPSTDDKLEITCKFSNTSSTGALFNAGTGNTQLIFTNSATQFYYRHFGDTSGRGIKPQFDELLFIECFSNGSLWINNTQKLAPTGNEITSGVNTPLFIGANANNTRYFSGDIRDVKLIASDGTIKLDLRPCTDHNNVVCMYDMVTRQYFYNQGEGEFKTGRFVDYIESTGTQYIDTGLNLDACRVEIVAECTTLPATGGYQQLFSKNYDYAGCAIFACNPNWGVRSATQTNTPSNKKSTIIADFSLENTFPKVVMTIDGVTVGYARTNLPSSANRNWSLMSSPNRSFGLKGRVYSCKMYDLENNLLRDLRPHIYPNGEVCMYDMVTRQHFYNKGNGEFGYGE